MAVPSSLLFTFVFLSLSFTEIRSDDRPIILFDEFRFTHRGSLELNVSKISLSNPNPDLELSKVGFFLCTRDSWLHVLQQIEDAEITCAVQSTLIKPVYTFDSLREGAKSFDTLYLHDDTDQYTLVFANCLPQLKILMTVGSAMYNLDGKSGNLDYLSAENYGMH